MNDLQIFNHPMFGDVRFVELNGEPYAVGIDVAKALEYKKPSQAVIDHCKGIRKLRIPSKGGIQETNVIPKGDILRLIVKAADQSKNKEIKEKAEEFEKWIFDDVIPTVLKHGAYMTPEKIEEVLLNPDTIIKIATALKEEQEKRKAVELQLEQQRPKVLFAESVSASNTSILIRDLAKLITQNGVPIGEKRLFAWLRENGYLIKKPGSDYNSPTQRAMEMGLFEIKETTINRTHGVQISKTPKVTGRGQIYFINKFLSNKK